MPPPPHGSCRLSHPSRLDAPIPTPRQSWQSPRRHRTYSAAMSMHPPHPDTTRRYAASYHHD
eukprot:scaffold2588_cov45-Cyclotella_meneghiniana.AAC.1